jgi:tRNA-dihydrouridine synthase
MIYLAPIQGFTDFVYRKVYATIFADVDAYFIPYISIKKNQILDRHKKEILPKNNPQKKVIPQVLVKDAQEMLYLTRFIKNLGYKEINLNLGCPYPMATNRNKGAALLPHPEKVETILSAFFEKENIQLSVKLRAGLETSKEIEEIIPVLNKYPLTEVILHPRIAKQFYMGAVSTSVYKLASENLRHNLVYNGDIFSLKDFEVQKQLFSGTKNWMRGRGILRNPFLPAEIKQLSTSCEEKVEMLKLFHRSIFEEYLNTMDNDGNTLNKMKEFWSYFCYNFPDHKKTFKTIKKTRNLVDFKIQIQKVFSGSD